MTDYYIYDVPKGSPKNRRKYFKTHADARNYIRKHQPEGAPKGVFHIYPTDNSGYTSPSDGRKSFGNGNRQWEQRQKK